MIKHKYPLGGETDGRKYYWITEDELNKFVSIKREVVAIIIGFILGALFW